MRSFEGNLGVECSYCHARNAATGRPDFASDANPMKDRARVMMKMTHAIDAEYLTQLTDPSSGEPGDVRHLSPWHAEAGRLRSSAPEHHERPGQPLRPALRPRINAATPRPAARSDVLSKRCVRAALLFNPRLEAAGSARLLEVQRAAEVLRRNGIDAEVLATCGPGTADAQAADAVKRGADLVFACGGDGTLHDVIQGLAQNLEVTVGIVPLGSANALARHLGLAFDPAQAIRQQLKFAASTIPLGRVTCETPNGPRARFFAVMAGAGPDGMLVYRMLARSKHRLGRWMYYVRAARLFLTSRFVPFRVDAQSDVGIIRARSCQCDGNPRRQLGRRFQAADPRRLS